MRLLKNIGGLWLLAGVPPTVEPRPAGRFAYDDLLAAAATIARVPVAVRSRSHDEFLQSGRHAGGDRSAYCRRTGQPAPRRSGRAFARAILESLAFSVPRRARIAREPDRRPRSTRFASSAADRATGCSISSPPTRPAGPSIAGPVEATALGNIAMQMLATGAVGIARGGAGDHRTVVSDRALRSESRTIAGTRQLPVGFRTTWRMAMGECWPPRHRAPARICGTRRARGGARRRQRAAASCCAIDRTCSARDLRITNFGGGNTSSKFDLPDPLTGEPTPRAGGEGQRRRSRARSRVAASRVLHLDKLERSSRAIGARRTRTRWSDLYPLCALRRATASPPRSTRRCTRSCRSRTSITCTPTGRSPWPRAPTASASSRSSIASYGRQIVWVPWQRPGFELALMLRRAVEAEPGVRRPRPRRATGCSRGSTTQRECYANSIATIDQMGEFIDEHARSRAAADSAVRRRRARGHGSRGGRRTAPPAAARAPSRPARRVVAHWTTREDALNVRRTRTWADDLCRARHELPGSLPAHAHLSDVRAVRSGTGRVDLTRARTEYRREYAAYYQRVRRARVAGAARQQSVRGRRSGLGVFGFGRDKREARITSEFFVNAIHVMAGRDRARGRRMPDVPDPAKRDASSQLRGAAARARRSGIEYWALEEAKLRRQPPEKEFSRTRGARRRRRQRHRTRSRASSSPAAARTSWSRTSDRGERRGGLERGCAPRRPRTWAWRSRSI